ncbi:hypothetical protein JDV02_005695 [Purpureocillium takamizusanense]|uniref:Uncharacterized protein n=1 Tax=Purpureocillium takamizusanense TaxID=2060973 RepID=A0A9Q8QGZ1_9HYPO|nr:uncharacterized protein JDV02_005695 [Purpureocillium takamizusanense]UNI19513.1 hypothetical protein JDV02_005695 [Purpureocillium takamizusanense]
MPRRKGGLPDWLLLNVVEEERWYTYMGGKCKQADNKCYEWKHKGFEFKGRAWVDSTHVPCDPSWPCRGDNKWCFRETAEPRAVCS